MSQSTDPGNREGPSAVAAKRPKWVFRVLAMLLPIVLLVVVELVGRLFGYGGIPSVVTTMNPGADEPVMGIDNAGVESFFNAHRNVGGRILSTTFPRRKRPDSVRIFVVGGSAAQGYPQPRNLTLTAFLEAMLGEVWPDREVEIINLGVVAVASFPVLCIYEEAIECDPDLMIVYAGNNEYFGAQGTASVHSFGRSASAMKLFRESRRSALVQMLDDLTRGSRADLAGKGLMEAMVAEPQIAMDDPRRRAAEDNLRAHIAEMIALGNSRGVPTIVCTLPGNERDMFPLGEDFEAPLPPSAQSRYSELIEVGRSKLGSDPRGALTALEAASALHEPHALLHYLMGRCCTALGDDAAALEHYIRSLDLDTMPWRAPSGSNRAVREAAATGAAALCDLQAVFRARSPGGSIGWELMDDHVHPSLAGQALVARAIVNSMTDLPERLRVDTDAAQSLPSDEVYAMRLGATLYDEYSTIRDVLALYELPFFQRSNREAFERFLARRDELEEMMSPAERQAARQWAVEANTRQGELPLTGVIGRVALGEGDLPKADQLLSAARRQLPRLSPGMLEYGSMLLEVRSRLRPTPSADDVALAEEILDAGGAMARFTGGEVPFSVWRDMGLAAQRLGRRSEAIEHLTRAARLVQTPRQFMVVRILVENLLAENEPARARAIVESLSSRPEIAAQCARMMQDLAAAGG